MMNKSRRHRNNNHPNPKIMIREETKTRMVQLVLKLRLVNQVTPRKKEKLTLLRKLLQPRIKQHLMMFHQS